MPGPDPYAVLDVPRDAGPSRVRQAYETAVNRAHRDGAHARLVELSQAYDTLADPHRRALYDRHGLTAVRERSPGAAPLPASWRTAPDLAPPRRPAPRRRTRAVVLTALVLSGATAAAWWDARPDQPLGRPAAAPGGQGGYSFMVEQSDGSGRPVTFDPCQPIHYVLRPTGQPPSGRAMLAQALQEVSHATGLVFVDDGTTDEAPSEQRHLRRRWSLRRSAPPVLVAWSTAAEWPALEGTTAGEAGPVHQSVAGGPARLVTGQVVLDAEDLAHAPGDAAGAAAVRLLLLHELGHLVGLGHVDDPTQLMHETSSAALAGYGDGDLRGLHELGSGPCS